MAAGLGFKTFTTGEVLTAADTNGYLMQGVLVFASSAARAAAITSPQEGQYSYLKDTNSTEYYDGAAWIAAPIGDITGVTAGTGISGGGTSGTVTITNSMATEITAKGDLIAGTGSATFDNLPVGTNGQTLVADSSTATGLKWATPATSASGLTLITSQTLSAVNSVSIDNCFTTTYDNYLVMASVVISSGANVQVRLRASGSTDSTSNYDFFNERVRYDNTIAIADTGMAQSSWNYMGSIGSAAGYYSTIALNFFGPKLARNTTLRGQVNDISTATNVFGQYNSVGNFRGTTAFDGFYLAMTGAPTMTGEIRVYGYQNS